MVIDPSFRVVPASVRDAAHIFLLPLVILLSLLREWLTITNSLISVIISLPAVSSATFLLFLQRNYTNGADVRILSGKWMNKVVLAARGARRGSSPLQL